MFNTKTLCGHILSLGHIAIHGPDDFGTWGRDKDGLYEHRNNKKYPELITWLESYFEGFLNIQGKLVPINHRLRSFRLSLTSDLLMKKECPCSGQ